MQNPFMLHILSHWTQKSCIFYSQKCRLVKSFCKMNVYFWCFCSTSAGNRLGLCTVWSCTAPEVSLALWKSLQPQFFLSIPNTVGEQGFDFTEIGYNFCSEAQRFFSFFSSPKLLLMKYKMMMTLFTVFGQTRHVIWSMCLWCV